MKLKNYIIFIQKDILQGEEEEILEIISRRVGNDQMSTLIERLRRENEAIREKARKEAREEARKEVREEARKEARKEVREELLKKMLKNGEVDEKIKMYTNATDEQIKNSKKQLGIIV